MAIERIDEVLDKALSSDTAIIPRYDVVQPDGTKIAENVEFILKNPILTPGMPINKQVIDECLAASGKTTGDSDGLYLAQPGYALADGALIRFNPNIEIRGAISLNINNTGSRAVRNYSQNKNIHLIPNSWYMAIYSASINSYILIDPAYLQDQIDMLTADTALVSVHVVNSAQKNVGGIPVSGMLTLSGETVKTNSKGIAYGYCAAGSPVIISIPEYTDYFDGQTSVTINPVASKTYSIDLCIGTPRDYAQIKTSQDVIFSPRLAEINVTVVGGGGGGAGAIQNAAGGGGGGGYCVTQDTVPFKPNVVYGAIVGAGGEGGRGSSIASYAAGHDGGSSSILGISARGGYGAPSGGKAGGTGNGKGGAAGSSGSGSVGLPGYPGSKLGYLTNTETVRYGGGGGGGGLSLETDVEPGNGGRGGSDYGGEGGKRTTDALGTIDYSGATAQAGTGGGGGGGANKQNSTYGNGGDGGAGIIVFVFYE